MKVFVLFAQRKETYPGEFAPIALNAIDDRSVAEFSDIENFSLEDITQETIANWEQTYSDLVFTDVHETWSWFEIDLGPAEQTLRKALLNPPKLAGKLKEESVPKGNHPSYGSITVQQGRTPGVIQDDEFE